MNADKKTFPFWLILPAVALVLTLFFIIFPFKQATAQDIDFDKQEQKMIDQLKNKKEAYFGGGCFWCIEAVFQEIKGVAGVESGYAGGIKDNPTYYEVSSGETGHAEVVKIIYDPKIVSYDELLVWFFKSHDPTTLNRQGADVGTQYRSIILYQSIEEKNAVETYIQTNQNKFKNKITTEIIQLDRFWPAETYHQNYFAKNPNAAYCRIVIAPKLDKLFPDP